MKLILSRPRYANVQELITHLTRDYGFTEDEVRLTIIPVTAEHESQEWKIDGGGWVTVRYYGLSRFGLEEHSGNRQAKKVATPHPRRYSRDIPDLSENRKDNTMPARGRRQSAQAAPPEPETQNGDVDFSVYLTKDISDTMTDYITWFEQNVAKLEDVEIDRLLVLGSSLYPHFQKSDFNIERREARRAAREAASEPEPAAATPARRGGRAAAAKPAAAASAPAGGKPAARGRRGSRATATAGAGAATPDAPF